MAVLTATAQLAASAINGGSDERTEGGVNAARACELRRYINRHLLDPDLTPESLAQRFDFRGRRCIACFKVKTDSRAT